MGVINQPYHPTNTEQKAAMESLSALEAVLSTIDSEKTEIEIGKTNDKIEIPKRALLLLVDILKAMSGGKEISIIPVAAEISTQQGAEILGCSRPYLVKLLDGGRIPFIKVGKHRRVKFEDILKYKRKMKEEQKKHLIDMMVSDEEIGLYDS